MTKHWTEKDKQNVARLVGEGKSTEQIAKHYKKTPGSVRGICRRLGIALEKRLPKVLHSVASSTVDQDRERTRAKLQAEEHQAAVKKYHQVLREQELDDRVVEIFQTSIDEAYGTSFNISVRPYQKVYRGESVEEDAVLVISDTHVGKLVEPNETNGFGLYNPLRYLAKLEHLENIVSHILQERNGCKLSNPIRHLHVMLLGDLVDGMLNHAEEIPGHTYVSQQVHLAAVSLFQTIARLAQIVDRVSVYGIGGNHARWPNQKKPPTTGRFSNLDTIVLEWLQSLFDVSPVKNVSFRLERSLHQIIDIQGTRLCVSHGDHLKGGDKAMGVPIHAIAREINSMTQRLAARGQQVPRYYIVADKHKRIELPTARGSFMVNGAFPGTDGYSLSGGFSETLPEQLFFGLHPRIGKSWSYNLNVGDDMVPVRKLKDLNFQLPTLVKEDVAKFE